MECVIAKEVGYLLAYMCTCSVTVAAGAGVDLVCESSYDIQCYTRERGGVIMIMYEIMLLGLLHDFSFVAFLSLERIQLP